MSTIEFRRRRRRPPVGTTVVELCVVMLVTAALYAIALPRLRTATDRVEARSAIQEASSLFSLARRSAIARRANVGVVIDSVAGLIVVRSGVAVIATRGLKWQYGVRISSTRDS